MKFQVKDDQGKLSQYGDLSKMYFLIWTTTIWTLPGNLAIALHPDESYALVKADNGETYIMAEALVEKVMKVGGVDSYEIVETHPGSFFENMLAQHPFLDKTSRLLLATTSPWTPAPAASTPPLALARTTIRPAAGTAWRWWSPWTTQGPPH